MFTQNRTLDQGSVFFNRSEKITCIFSYTRIYTQAQNVIIVYQFSNYSLQCKMNINLCVTCLYNKESTYIYTRRITHDANRVINLINDSVVFFSHSLSNHALRRVCAMLNMILKVN